MATSLRLQADGSDGSGLVVCATERCVTLKEEDIDNPMARVSINPDARPAKAGPGPTAFNATTASARPGTEGGDMSHLLAVREPKIFGYRLLAFISFNGGDTVV